MKHKKKGKSARRIAQRPDEVFAAGPLRMERFGRHTVSKVEWQPGDFDKFQERLVADYDAVVQEIDRDVADAAALVATLNPLVILHRAWWERSAAYLKIESEIAVQHEHVHATRMLDYVQSLIAGTSHGSVPDQLSEEVWTKLQKLVESIFQKLNSRYFLCATAKRRKESPGVDPAFEEFHFKTQLYWCNVTGEQYQNHQVQALRELLAPQSEIILQLYNFTTEQLCAELSKILHSLTRGIGDAFEAMNSFKEKSLAALEADVKSGVAGQGEMSQLLQESIVRHGLESDQNLAVGLFILYDLFDLQKVTTLPTAFLEDFSWSPGQDGEFFGEGDFRGWPLRIWPTFKRPFIKLDGRYYCFDQTSLFDHFYRQLEKRVFAAGKNVKQSWIDARKGVTETLPFDYLQRLLPGAVCFKEAYYYLMGEGGKSASRYETDGFLTFDDHLFIVEVKSGAFTYTSPATDVDAHVQSLKNLVADPAKQGNRFLRYLHSAEEVAVMDEAGNEMTKLRLQDYRQVTVCAVTLDPFTEIAAQIQHLPAIGVEVGIDPVWSLSVDDLRVYADIFTNPLEFLHFVQQRKEAFKSKILQLDDELDHLGLYLRHNHYATHAGDLAGGPNAQLQFLGYREEIDKLFNKRLLEGPVPSPLRQKMPVGMANLLDLLQASGKKGRSAIAAYLLDVSGEWRDRLFDTLVQEVAQDDQKRPRPFSTYGEIRLTAVPRTPHWGRPSAEDSRNHVKAIMVMNNEPDRVLLDLSYSEHGHLVEADWQFLQRSDITLFELPILQAKAELLRESSLRKAVATKGRIGRNDMCPCGSAKKFKKCCLGKE